MSKSTISTFQLFERFPDKESARVYFEQRLWPVGPVCPVCKGQERITVRKDGYYRCNACQTDFTVRTGTVLERSHVGLREWLLALALIADDPELPTEQLAEAIGTTQKTAHLTRARIHEAAHALMAAHLDADNPAYAVVAGFPGYRVGRDGSAWTRYRLGRGGRMGFTWRPIHPVQDRDGYRKITMSKPGGVRQVTRKVAVLVCRAFHGTAPSAAHECRHLDGDCTHDAADNLAWGTATDNAEDRRRHGRAPVGEQNGHARLSEARITEIRALKGRMRQADIGAAFGVTQSHVSRIQRGAQWRERSA